MFKLYYALGFLWTLPVSILGWIFMGLMYTFRQVEAVNVYPDLTIVWDLRNKCFFCRKVLGRWFGFVIGCNIVVLDVGDSHANERCYLHERKHAMQNYCWGPFFYPAYVIESLRVYLFCPCQHTYLDNRFERDAREYAGQPVNIPRSQWPDGTEDRVPWW